MFWSCLNWESHLASKEAMWHPGQFGLFYKFHLKLKQCKTKFIFFISTIKKKMKRNPNVALPDFLIPLTLQFIQLTRIKISQQNSFILSSVWTSVFSSVKWQLCYLFPGSCRFWRIKDSVNHSIKIISFSLILLSWYHS